MLVSIATTILTFMLTMVGGASALAGCKVVAARVSVAGSTAFRSRQRVADSAVVPNHATMSNPGDLEAVNLGTWLQTSRCMFQCVACINTMEWYLACAEAGAGDRGPARGVPFEALCSFKRDLQLLLPSRLSDPPQLGVAGCGASRWQNRIIDRQPTSVWQRQQMVTRFPRLQKIA